jgi:hypothetical protein
MTLHLREVDGQSIVSDGDQPIPVPAGWSIAKGSPDDFRVCAAHAWQSHCLVFADGNFFGTAACDKNSLKGNAAIHRVCSASVTIATFFL